MRAREEATMQEFYRKGFAAGQAQYEELVKTHASRGQLEALGLTPTAPASGPGRLGPRSRARPWSVSRRWPSTWVPGG